jgi:hypothetical protein
MTDGRCMHGGQVTIKMEFKEIMWGCAHWNYLAQTREQKQAVVNMVMRHLVP